MKNEPQFYVSPNYTYQKLESPLFKDMVDVFEDRMLNWLVNPAKILLNTPHGSIPAVALATNYIEGIEIYISGKDSEGKSKQFFRSGFKRIFAPVDTNVKILDLVSDSIYKALRCGFVHEGMSRNRVFFSYAKDEAFTITWPKNKNGEFLSDGYLESVVINPKRYIECIELHFRNYIRELRMHKSDEYKEEFKSAIKLIWGLEQEAPLVAMTEGEFFYKSKS